MWSPVLFSSAMWKKLSEVVEDCRGGGDAREAGFQGRAGPREEDTPMKVVVLPSCARLAPFRRGEVCVGRTECRVGIGSGRG